MSSKKKSGPVEVQLWGEISKESRGAVSKEFLRTLIRGAVKQEEPKKLPVADDPGVSFELPERLTKPNEYVLHTIKLNAHAKAVQRLIDGVAGKTEFKVCPFVPEMNEQNTAQEINEIKQESKIKMEAGNSSESDVMKDNPSEDGKDDLKPDVLSLDPGYTPEVPVSFVLGQGPELPVLDQTNINLMLQKAVLITLAETGFDKANKSAVNVLIDVVKQILTKICKLLHLFSQHDVMRDRTSYKDPLEKVLQLLGLSGIKELDQYYKKNVMGKRDQALSRSNSLVNQYNSLVNIVKELAIESDEATTPEVNFSSSSLSDLAIQSSLEPHFQQLLDLEAETQLDIPQESILDPKAIIKKRISPIILQLKKKQKVDQ